MGGTKVAVVPGWLRDAVSETPGPAALEEVAFAAGAALAALDAVVRRQARWSGAWRGRLALGAGAVAARQSGRVEDEAALRDAVLLTRPGDDVGPAGRLLLAWHGLARRPAAELLTASSLAATMAEFGHAPDDERVGDLAGALRRLSEGGTVEMLTGAFVAAARHDLGRPVGAWLADALLAQRLGWPHAVPLLGGEPAGDAAGRRRRGAGGVVAQDAATEPDRRITLLAAHARAALRAVDLAADLERRAERLIAIAPKLRARGAARVVERLLSVDAIVASDTIGGMSDRGLRRLFDRLVSLGAARELSGRPTFRIYGL